MARVTYGSGVTELAGSIGGVTYQKNASGNIAKLRANPTVNPTSLQAGYQTNMAKLISYWPTLSQANKDAWNAFAAAHNHTTPWGEIKTLSGYQWFLSINLTRIKRYTPPLSSPPSWVSESAPNSFTLAATVGYLRLEWVPAYNPFKSLQFFLSLPLRQSSLKLRRSLFFVGYRDGSSAMDYYDVTSRFESLANISWGAFYNSADCSIICRINYGYMSQGLMSPFTSAIVKIG